MQFRPTGTIRSICRNSGLLREAATLAGSAQRGKNQSCEFLICRAKHKTADTKRPGFHRWKPGSKTTGRSCRRRRSFPLCLHHRNCPTRPAHRERLPHRECRRLPTVPERRRDRAHRRDQERRRCRDRSAQQRLSCAGQASSPPLSAADRYYHGRIRRCREPRGSRRRRGPRPEPAKICPKRALFVLLETFWQHGCCRTKISYYARQRGK